MLAATGRSAVFSANSSCSPQAGQAARLRSCEPKVCSRSANTYASRRPILSSASRSRDASGKAAINSVSARSSGCWLMPISHRRTISCPLKVCISQVLYEVGPRGSGWLRIGRLRRLLHGVVALPALVLQLNMLDSDGVVVGIQIRHPLGLGHPAAVVVVGNDQLPGLVIHFKDHILAEILERHLLSQVNALLS